MTVFFKKALTVFILSRKLCYSPYESSSFGRPPEERGAYLDQVFSQHYTAEEKLQNRKPLGIWRGGDCFHTYNVPLRPIYFVSYGWNENSYDSSYAIVVVSSVCGWLVGGTAEPRTHFILCQALALLCLSTSRIWSSGRDNIPHPISGVRRVRSGSDKRR